MFICDAMYLQSKGIQTENDIRDTVIYARVSTRNQKDDLQNQIEFLKQFCNAKCKELGIELRIVDRWYPSSKLCHECGCRHVPMALVGNLRLWTVQELVSSVLLVIAKAYRMKQ